MAGGLTLEADTDSIEITSAHTQDFGSPQTANTTKKRTTISFSNTAPESYIISAGDSVRINQKFSKIDNNTVLIIGEVRHPGEYDLLAGDYVSDLIERAGGLNQQAYAHAYR